MSHEIRPGRLSDVDAIAAMMPDLASFETLEGRNSKDLWEGDLATLHRWRNGQEPNVLVHVAEAPNGDVAGFTMVSMREEAMSHEPSSHLEAIVVQKNARGAGLGTKLLANAEHHAKLAGARTMTLHVFEKNERARAVYKKAGYDEEIIRDIKQLT